jgi:2-hydroxychromene-2-carboxylate isomerase
MTTVHFFFDYLSPYAYLANTQIRALAELGAQVEFRPVRIVEVMKRVNNQPSPKCPPKARYSGIDAKRWAVRYGVPLGRNIELWSAVASGSFDPSILIRGALVAMELGVFDAYHSEAFRAVWSDPRDVVSAHGRAALLERAQIAQSTFWDRAMSPAIGERSGQDIQEAVDWGVFGVPTFFVREEMFFGNDRLDFVRDAISADPTPRGEMR